MQSSDGVLSFDGGDTSLSLASPFSSFGGIVGVPAQGGNGGGGTGSGSGGGDGGGEANDFAGYFNGLRSFNDSDDGGGERRRSPRLHPGLFGDGILTGGSLGSLGDGLGAGSLGGGLQSNFIPGGGGGNSFRPSSRGFPVGNPSSPASSGPVPAASVPKAPASAADGLGSLPSGGSVAGVPHEPGAFPRPAALPQPPQPLPKPYAPCTPAPRMCSMNTPRTTTTTAKGGRDAAAAPRRKRSTASSSRKSKGHSEDRGSRGLTRQKSPKKARRVSPSRSPQLVVGADPGVALGPRILPGNGSSRVTPSESMAGGGLGMIPRTGGLGLQLGYAPFHGGGLTLNSSIFGGPSPSVCPPPVPPTVCRTDASAVGGNCAAMVGGGGGDGVGGVGVGGVGVVAGVDGGGGGVDGVDGVGVGGVGVGVGDVAVGGVGSGVSVGDVGVSVSVGVDGGGLVGAGAGDGGGLASPRRRSPRLNRASPVSVNDGQFNPVAGVVDQAGGSGRVGASIGGSCGGPDGGSEGGFSAGVPLAKRTSNAAATTSKLSGNVGIEGMRVEVNGGEHALNRRGGTNGSSRDASLCRRSPRFKRGEGSTNASPRDGSFVGLDFNVGENDVGVSVGGGSGAGVVSSTGVAGVGAVGSGVGGVGVVGENRVGDVGVGVGAGGGGGGGDAGAGAGAGMGTVNYESVFDAGVLAASFPARRSPRLKAPGLPVATSGINNARVSPPERRFRIGREVDMEYAAETSLRMLSARKRCLAERRVSLVESRLKPRRKCSSFRSSVRS